LMRWKEGWVGGRVGGWAKRAGEGWRTRLRGVLPSVQLVR
jgi:hypothetical protein